MTFEEVFEIAAGKQLAARSTEFHEVPQAELELIRGDDHISHMVHVGLVTPRCGGYGNWNQFRLNSPCFNEGFTIEKAKKLCYNFHCGPMARIPDGLPPDHPLMRDGVLRKEGKIRLCYRRFHPRFTEIYRELGLVPPKYSEMFMSESLSKQSSQIKEVIKPEAMSPKPSPKFTSDQIIEAFSFVASVKKARPNDYKDWVAFAKLRDIKLPELAKILTEDHDGSVTVDDLEMMLN